MRFFTREWVNGGLDDQATVAVVPSYFQYLNELELPHSIHDLAELNPHDGYILEVEHSPTVATLRMRIRCGDLQVGYFDARLTFTGATIDADDLATLIRAQRPEEFEILYDEVDREPGQYAYRLLLYPDGEIIVRFNDVELVCGPRSDQRTE